MTTPPATPNSTPATPGTSTRTYRIVHYLLDPFIGARFPIGAELMEGESLRFVESPRMPGMEDYPGQQPLLALVRLSLRQCRPKNQRHRSPSPFVLFGDEHTVPDSIEDAAEWLVDMLAGGRRASWPTNVEYPGRPIDEVIAEIARNGRIVRDVFRADLCTLAERLDAHLKETPSPVAAECLARVVAEIRHREACASPDRTAVVPAAALPEVGPPSFERVNEHDVEHGGHWYVSRVYHDPTAPEEHTPMVLRLSLVPSERHPRLSASFPGIDVGGRIGEGKDPWHLMRGAVFIPLTADGRLMVDLHGDELLRAEVEAVHELVSRQVKILNGVARALKGESEPLTLHSHHDLAEVALRVRRELALAQGDLAAPGLPVEPRCGACNAPSWASSLRDEDQPLLDALNDPAPESPPMLTITAPHVEGAESLTAQLPEWVTTAAQEASGDRRAEQRLVCTAPLAEWVTTAAQEAAGDRRAETGVVQFGDDWPGVFIRGDAAHAWAHALGELNLPVLDGPKSSAEDVASGRAIRLALIEGLRQQLLLANVHLPDHSVDARLRPFVDCIAPDR
jgi:hypothetical protein